MRAVRMSLVSVLLLVGLSGNTPPEHKFNKAIDYINWRYTDNIMIRTEPVRWKKKYVVIKEVESVPDWDSLQRAMTKDPNTRQGLSETINGYKRRFSYLNSDEEFKKFIEKDISSSFIIGGKSFQIDTSVVHETKKGVLDYLNLNPLPPEIPQSGQLTDLTTLPRDYSPLWWNLVVGGTAFLAIGVIGLLVFVIILSRKVNRLEGSLNKPNVVNHPIDHTHTIEGDDEKTKAQLKAEIIAELKKELNTPGFQE
ncbi:hypothetical protein, partial [Spirosoma sp.]|uniref:hypothetical protein n=1 Tax=Spirosoma sp. TaxID=1899569 RepID=UPI003B3B9FCD